MGILYAYYRSSTGIIRINSDLSEEFIIEEGVNQGGKISPLLFNFFINDLILKLLKAKFTLSVGIEAEEIYSRYSLENNFNLSMIRDNSYIEFTLEKYKYDKNPMLDRYATRGDLYKVKYMESLLNKF